MRAMLFLCIGVFLIFYFGNTAKAGVEVAFLRVYGADGRPVELTPGPPAYAHVAIRFRGRWLHAHPQGGVQLSDDLRPFGQLHEILQSPSNSLHDWEEPLPAVVLSLLGKPYDEDFLWGDDKYYCSELVGMLLNVKPVPMRFDGPYWDAYFAARGNLSRPVGALGLSPDGLYQKLWEQGFRPLPRAACGMVMSP